MDKVQIFDLLNEVKPELKLSSRNLFIAAFIIVIIPVVYYVSFIYTLTLSIVLTFMGYCLFPFHTNANSKDHFTNPNFVFNVKSSSGLKSFTVAIGKVPSDSKLADYVKNKQSLINEILEYFDQIIAFLNNGHFNNVLSQDGTLINEFCFPDNMLYAIYHEAEKLKLIVS